MTASPAGSRSAAVAAEWMVATSQPTATRAGMRALERGGNAADAVLAAAAALAVSEPMMCGVGGDAFALVDRGGAVDGLDAAGPAPAVVDDPAVDLVGPRSVTVPGAVAGWSALARRHGRFGLDRALADAIDLAERGWAVAPITAGVWRASEPAGAPAPGERRRAPDLARTLRAIADRGPDALYGGPVAEAIAAASWLDEEDLDRYEPRWVSPLRHRYRDHEVLELPPPTQGVAVLEALGLLPEGPELPDLVRAVGLALEDALERVRDRADVADLLEPDFLVRRRAQDPRWQAELPGGTVYLCAVDAEGMAVSFIQSLFSPFGSRVVAAGTGVLLQNRAACFAAEGGVRAGARPFHTIIPGLLRGEGGAGGPFGVMGGFIQAQANVQFLHHLLDGGLNPQAALDAPRWRLDRGRLTVEEGLDTAPLRARGPELELVHGAPTVVFGGGQAILRRPDGALVAGSDRRKDGYAAGR